MAYPTLNEATQSLYDEKAKAQAYEEERRGTQVPVETRLNPMGDPLPTRLAKLAKQLADAGMEMQSARETYDTAVERKSKCEARFDQLSDQMINLAQELREGTPKGVPYQR